VIALGVNIDHVATVRQARRTYEPDPVWAAAEAQLGGADLITVHLREDRRHILDRDVRELAGLVQVRFNLEMAATDEMVSIARELRPHMVTLVPEGRQEITTEGGLDVAGQRSALAATVARLAEESITVAAFVDAEPEQIDAAAACGFDACELHTGPWAEAFWNNGRTADHPAAQAELARLRRGSEQLAAAGLRFHGGHALTYENVAPVAGLPGLRELHIGHSIVARAIFVGLREAVRQMKRVIGEAMEVQPCSSAAASTRPS
jgi:pyridoxine 5-phosphate synthase